MPNKSSARAFTLIELLVVIAIIAILAGLLFPVFARAKAAAKTITTVSNTHQLGEAIAIYSSDNDDRFPGAVDGSAGAGQLGGWVFYDVFGSTEAGHFDVSKGSVYTYTKSQNVYKSPNDADANKSGLSFAINGCLDAPRVGSSLLLVPRSTTEITDPSAMMMLGEEGSEGTMIFGDQHQRGTNDGFFNPDVDHFSEWHAGGTALVFVDSHAKVTKARDRFTQVLWGGTVNCWP